MKNHFPRHIEQRAHALQRQDKAQSGEQAPFDFYLGGAIRECLERIGAPAERIERFAETLRKFESPALADGLE